MLHRAFNTATSLVTFLMVFVLQNSQDRGSRACQAGLDDLILRIADADDDLVGAKDLDDKEPDRIRKYAQRSGGQPSTADPLPQTDG
jgi:low affinity Fe/Cu permease